MPVVLSPLYPILNAAVLSTSSESERERQLAAITSSLATAGVTMLQYRNKHDDDARVRRDATRLRLVAPRSLRILLNDRAHLVLDSGCDGVHVGQKDLRAAEARELIGPACILGVSTHNDEQLLAADRSSADYLAIGPVYATQSKADAEPVVGLEGVERARALTSKPLVAIGGITLARATAVRAAGADSIAVISALFGEEPGICRGPGTGSLAKLAEDFLHNLR